MNKIDIAMDLTGNSYPGRGIIIGKSENGKNAVTAYFIMGRSENSRNRVFVEKMAKVLGRRHLIRKNCLILVL